MIVWENLIYKFERIIYTSLCRALKSVFWYKCEGLVILILLFLTWNCSWTHNPAWFMFNVPFSCSCNTYRQIVIFSSWFMNCIYWMNVLCYCLVTSVLIAIIWNSQVLLFTYSWTEKPHDHYMRVCTCRLWSRNGWTNVHFPSDLFFRTVLVFFFISCQMEIKP